MKRVTFFRGSSCNFLMAGIMILLAWSCNSDRGTSSTEDSNADEVQPNILWIVGENLNLDLGIYGEGLVATPNLDSLGKNGMVYTHVFSTSPVCAPSRSAFMTGMYQTTTDTHNMRSHRDDDFRLPEGVRPLTQRLNDGGYYTANITRIGDRIVGTGKPLKKAVWSGWAKGNIHSLPLRKM